MVNIGGKLVGFYSRPGRPSQGAEESAILGGMAAITEDGQHAFLRDMDGLLYSPWLKNSPLDRCRSAYWENIRATLFMPSAPAVFGNGIGSTQDELMIAMSEDGGMWPWYMFRITSMAECNGDMYVGCGDGFVRKLVTNGGGYDLPSSSNLSLAYAFPIYVGTPPVPTPWPGDKYSVEYVTVEGAGVAGANPVYVQMWDRKLSKWGPLAYGKQISVDGAGDSDIMRIPVKCPNGADYYQQVKVSVQSKNASIASVALASKKMGRN